jgi:Glycosyl transferases group 1
MKIAFISQPEYFRFCYENDLANAHLIREFPFYFGMKDDELKDLLDFNADFNFFFRGEFFPEALLLQLDGKKVALSSEPFPRIIENKLEFSVDSIKRYLVFRSRIRTRKFDYVFHYDQASVEVMKQDGIHVSGAFPFPVATKTYLYKQVEKKWDFFFIGRSTLHRERYFGSLKHYFKFLHICHGMFGVELLDFIHQSAICLNVHAEDEISWEPRLQMLLASGAFVISEPITPNSFLRPGIDFIEAFSPSDMRQKAAYYLEHPEERNIIAISGRSRVEELLSCENNFPQLISDITTRAYPRFSTSSACIALNFIEYTFGCTSALNRFASKFR